MAKTRKKDHCTGLPASWVLTQKINKHCKQHDAEYVAQTKSKWIVDWEFYVNMRKDISFIPAALIGAGAAIGGIWFWYRRKWLK